MEHVKAMASKFPIFQWQKAYLFLEKGITTFYNKADIQISFEEEGNPKFNMNFDNFSCKQHNLHRSNQCYFI